MNARRYIASCSAGTRYVNPNCRATLLPGIRKQWKAQLVLIVHEERLLHRLRRNGDERRTASLLDLRHDEVHGFHLADAEWTPPAANEAEHEASIG